MSRAACQALFSSSFLGVKLDIMFAILSPQGLFAGGSGDQQD